MSEDPLRGALEEIAPKLDPELQRLVAELMEGQAIDESWQRLLQDVLDEA